MKWRRFFHRDRTDFDQRQELEFYLDVTAEEYMARGMDRQAAYDAARRKLGNVTVIREDVYQMDTLTFIEGVFRDILHALRMMRRNPGFTAAAVLSLVLGIGSTTAIFSVVNAVLIRPLPYPGSESLVGVFNTGEIQGEVFRDMGLAPGMYAALKERSTTFDEFGVWSSVAATLTGLGDPEQIKVVRMTPGILSALGAKPAIGRTFSADDDTPGSVETVILSYSYWMQRFGGNRNVLGTTATIDFVPRQIIGVLPRDFLFLDLSPDALLPQRFPRVDLPFEPFSYSGIAKLKPGVSLELANQDAARILNHAIPDGMRRFAEQARMKPNLRALKRDVTGDIGAVLKVLMGALFLVFLLVCANVANLVLVRAQSRTQEFAVRAALGAGWGRIARELLVESLTLGLFGGTGGMTLAYLVVELLKAQRLTAIPRINEASLDFATFAFGLAGSVAGSLLIGLIAVFKCAIPGRIQNARGSTGDLKQLRAQNGLVVAQVAIALILLIAGGLLIRTFLALHDVHVGFTEPQRIQSMRISIPETQVAEPERVARMQADIVEGVSRVPGVDFAALTDGLPMDSDYRNGQLIAVEDKFIPGQTPPNRVVKYVSPGLFATQGTRLLAGRDFTWDDVQRRRRVAIVSANMARENWGNPPAALGKRLRPGTSGDIWFEVVGVVEDVHGDGAHKPAPSMVYFRTGVQDPWRPDRPPSIRRGLTLAIRSSRAGSESLIRDIANVIHSVNSNLPLAQVRTQDDIYRRSLARTSFTLILLAVAGMMALALSIVGVYGVLAYSVGRRRREISIRVALGARPAQVKGLIVRRGLVLAGVGSGLGIMAALVLSRWIASLLFGVTAFDPATYLVSAGLVFGAALLASYIPARRASSGDPMNSLRAD